MTITLVLGPYEFFATFHILLTRMTVAMMSVRDVVAQVTPRNGTADGLRFDWSLLADYRLGHRGIIGIRNRNDLWTTKLRIRTRALY